MPRAALAVIVAVLIGVAPPAAAAWGSTASGSATARSATLSPPSGLIATCGTGAAAATVVLTWTVTPTPWADGYEVARGALPGIYTTTASVTSTSYTSPSLATGTYVFAVRATKGQWRSSYSNEVLKVVASQAGVAVCQ